MSMEHSNYRSVLKAELERRCGNNPRYSLRAFARDLQLTSARLSEVLNGKTGLSRERAEQLGKRIGLSHAETEYFCDMVESEDGRSAVKREIAKKRLQKYLVPEYQQLQLDAFKIIADWYHYAILELSLVKGFESDPAWIGKALDISEMEAKLAIERLERLELIERVDGVLRAKESFTTSTDGIPSDAIRKFHSQILAKAEKAMHLRTLEERNLSAVTLAFDSRRVAEAVTRIRTFRGEFDREFSPARGSSPDSVYCLSIQLFPLSKPVSRTSNQEKSQ